MAPEPAYTPRGRLPLPAPSCRSAPRRTIPYQQVAPTLLPPPADSTFASGPLCTHRARSVNSLCSSSGPGFRRIPLSALASLAAVCRCLPRQAQFCRPPPFSAWFMLGSWLSRAHSLLCTAARAAVSPVRPGTHAGCLACFGLGRPWLVSRVTFRCSRLRPSWVTVSYTHLTLPTSDQV